jgi:uncharacterized protein with HEPN domain
LRNLQTTAESTQRISERLRVRHPEVEWARISAFRNVLVHGYLGVDLARVWDITQSNVPELKRQAQAMLKDLDSGASHASV